MKKYYYGIKELHFSFRDCNGYDEGEIAIIVGNDSIMCHCRYGELQPRNCTFEISKESWKSFLDMLVKKHKVFRLNKKMIKDASQFDDDLDVHLCINRTFFRKIELDAELGNYYIAPIFCLIQKYIFANQICHCHKCSCMSEFRVC